MDVAVSSLRAQLATWLDRVRAGEEVVVTDRGVPVARIVPVGSTSLLEQLAEKGVLSRATGARPSARAARRVRSRGSVAELVGEQRR